MTNDTAEQIYALLKQGFGLLLFEEKSNTDLNPNGAMKFVLEVSPDQPVEKIYKRECVIQPDEMSPERHIELLIQSAYRMFVMKVPDMQNQNPYSDLR
jgi:hypothetical protein